MTEILILLLTAIPILLGIAIGYRSGLRRILWALCPLVAGWTLSLAVIIAVINARWFWPFGLFTPVICGLVSGEIARQLLRGMLGKFSRKVAASSATTGPGHLERAAGASLGAGMGFCLAAFAWLAMLLLVAALPSKTASIGEATPPSAPSLPGALLEIAHRGFVKHLPLLGPIGDEVEALTYILKARAEARDELARELGWDQLAALPSFRAILGDRETVEDLDRLRDGDFKAVFNLQLNPRIIAFFEEEAVRKLVLETRPTDLAERLAEIGRRQEWQRLRSMARARWTRAR
jgi:hypothetical protein